MSLSRIFAPQTWLDRFCRRILLRALPHWRLRAANSEAATPLLITAIGSAFWATRALMTAVELGVFTCLGDGAKTATELERALGMHHRSSRDFLDALVALQLLNRHGSCYENTLDTQTFLNERSDLYIGGAITMADARLYAFWGNLSKALRTGRPQNELGDGRDQFTAIYADPRTLRLFASAMTSVSIGPGLLLAASEDWTCRQVIADIGTAEGIVLAKIAAANPHLHVIGVDLPELKPLFTRMMADHHVDRATYVSCNIFEEPWPPADVYILGHMLHNFDGVRRRYLLGQAFESLPRGGKVIVYDAMIDPERRRSVVGLLMSLNMLIETPDGRDYTRDEAVTFLRDAGFSSLSVRPLTGFDWMASGTKP